MLPTLTDREAAALKARIDFMAFCIAIYPPFEYEPAVPAHIRLIVDALAKVARYIETKGAEGIGRLRIELPPRHGKSQLVARLFPAWIMGRNPDLRVILTSHGAELSGKHSRFVRNTIRSDDYGSIFPRVHLAEDSQARDAWDIAAPYQGGLLAIGNEGSVTGRGAGLIICDDLVKGREHVESDAQREKLWDWYTSDLLTRQEPRAAIIHIGTRWHVDDILGRLDQSDRWHVIRLPALAEEGDPLGRPPGAALWPVRFNVAALEEQRAAMGEYPFSALYQQSPVPSSGGIFSREKFIQVDELPGDIEQWVRFWDLALSEKQTADSTVGVLLGRTKDKRFVVADVDRSRTSWQDSASRMVAAAQRDGTATQIGIEEVLFSVLAVKELSRLPELHSYSIRGYPAHKDKLTRALPFAARVDTGMVYVLRRAWTQAFLDELCSFNKGKHDDQVDACSGAYEMFASASREVTTFPNPWTDPEEFREWQEDRKLANPPLATPQPAPQADGKKYRTLPDGTRIEVQDQGYLFLGGG